jgi:hypothetical protein
MQGWKFEDIHRRAAAFAHGVFHHRAGVDLARRDRFDAFHLGGEQADQFQFCLVGGQAHGQSRPFAAAAEQADDPVALGVALDIVEHQQGRLGDEFRGGFGQGADFLVPVGAVDLGVLALLLHQIDEAPEVVIFDCHGRGPFS